MIARLDLAVLAGRAFWTTSKSARSVNAMSSRRGYRSGEPVDASRYALQNNFHQLQLTSDVSPENGHKAQNYTWTPSIPIAFRNAPANEDLPARGGTARLVTRTSVPDLSTRSGSCRRQQITNSQNWTSGTAIRFPSSETFERPTHSNGTSHMFSNEEELQKVHTELVEGKGSSQL